MYDFDSLSHFNTPEVQIPNEDNEIFVKREDLLPFSFGGNKVRIAIELIKDMHEKGNDCIVGYGNARSNLSRALANLCYTQNIPCHIISPSDDNGTRTDTFNSKIVHDCNAEFHYCSKNNVKETVENVLAELKSVGYKPYYIYGEANGKGNERTPLEAYRKVYEEIKCEYDYIFLPTGTGMTQAGLLAGKSLDSGKEKIVGISIARPAMQEKEVIKEMLVSYCVDANHIDEEEIIIDDSYLAGGYAKYNYQIEAIIRQQMIQNGMPLDPTYTGKAFWGMQDYLKKNSIINKKILFMHTGGTPLFFDYESTMEIRIAEDVQAVEAAIVELEGNLSPSLTERNIDLSVYSEKLFLNGRVWIHFDGGRPVSIIAGYFNDKIEHIAYLSIFAVERNYRQRKLGTLLLSEFELYARECGMEKIKLEVRKTNNTAYAFYKKHGYEIIGEAGDDSYYMLKHLNK